MRQDAGTQLRLSDYRCRLRTTGAIIGAGSVAEILNSERKALLGLSAYANRLSASTKQVSTLFSQTERALIGDTETEEDKIAPDAQDSPEKPLDWVDKIFKVIKVIANWDGIDRQTEPPKWMDGIGGLIGLLSAMTALNNVKDISKLPERILKFFGSGIKLDKEVIKLLDKYSAGSNTTFIKKLSHLTNVIGFFESCISHFRETGEINFEFFKNSGSITNSIKDFIMGFKDIGGDLKGFEKFKTKFDFDIKTVSPILAAINMGIYGLFDGIEKVKDGVTMQEYGEWLKGTGVTGANTMISAITLGLVNLDTNSVLNNYKDVEQYVKGGVDNLVDSLHLPDGAKKIMYIPASIPVAIWGMEKSLIDFGRSIGDNILEFFGWLG